MCVEVGTENCLDSFRLSENNHQQVITYPLFKIYSPFYCNRRMKVRCNLDMCLPKGVFHYHKHRFNLRSAWYVYLLAF